MRNLTLSIIALGTCFLVFTNVHAQAGTMFTFDGGIEDESSNKSIGKYMSRVMGSKVLVNDAEVNDNNDRWFDTYWFHKDWSDNFLRCDSKTGDIEIYFSKPITRAYGNGYAFIPNFCDYDFNVTGYTQGFGNYKDPNPDAMVNSQCVETGWRLKADFDIHFDKPVSLLVLSDSGKQWIGVDNLGVEMAPVPVPGAGLLGMLGMGITGWLKRRKTL